MLTRSNYPILFTPKKIPDLPLVWGVCLYVCVCLCLCTRVCVCLCVCSRPMNQYPLWLLQPPLDSIALMSDCTGGSAVVLHELHRSLLVDSLVCRWVLPSDMGALCDAATHTYYDTAAAGNSEVKHGTVENGNSPRCHFYCVWPAAHVIALCPHCRHLAVPCCVYPDFKC